MDQNRVYPQPMLGKKMFLKWGLKRMLINLKYRADELKSVMKLELERLKQAFEFYDTPCPFD